MKDINCEREEKEKKKINILSIKTYYNYERVKKEREAPMNIF